MTKPFGSRDLAFNIQQQAHDRAEEEARSIPWQLLQEARSQYIDWQEFYFWARSVMEGEGSVPTWLAEQGGKRDPSGIRPLRNGSGTQSPARHSHAGILGILR